MFLPGLVTFWVTVESSENLSGPYFSSMSAWGLSNDVLCVWVGTIVKLFECERKIFSTFEVCAKGLTHALFFKIYENLDIKIFLYISWSKINILSQNARKRTSKRKKFLNLSFPKGNFLWNLLVSSSIEWKNCITKKIIK